MLNSTPMLFSFIFKVKYYPRPIDFNEDTSTGTKIDHKQFSVSKLGVSGKGSKSRVYVLYCDVLYSTIVAPSAHRTSPTTPQPPLHHHRRHSISGSYKTLEDQDWHSDEEA